MFFPSTFNELGAEDPTPIEPFCIDITETHQAFKHTSRTRFDHGEIWCVCPANAHLPACRRYRPVWLFKLNGHSFGMSPQEIDCAMPEWPGNPRDLYETFRARFSSYMAHTVLLLRLGLHHAAAVAGLVRCCCNHQACAVLLLRLGSHCAVAAMARHTPCCC